MRQLTTCLVALSALAACGGDDAPSPTDVRSAIHGDLAHVLTEAQAASDGTIAKLPSTDLFQSFVASEASGMPNQLQQWLDFAHSITTSATIQNATGDADEEFDPDAITKMLEEQLFTDANHLGNGIYRVPVSLVCADDDADCANSYAKVQPRVRVASDDDELVFFVQIDKNHDEPLSLSLSHDRIAVTVNLDEATDAMAALGEGSSAKLSGAVTGSLTILGAAHAKLAVDIDRAISVELDDTKFATAASHLLAVDLDGNASKASLSVALGETTAHVPGDSFDPRVRDYSLAGLTVDATFDGTTVALSNVSLGNKTLSIKVAAQDALAVDLNSSNGRKLSATLANDTLTVSPLFDLQIKQDHTLLGDEQPTFDITRVKLEGSLRSHEETGAVEVVNGAFAITTNPAEYGFSASAGQCVLGADEGFTVDACN